MKAFALFKNLINMCKEVIKLTWETSPKYTIYTLFLLTATSLIPLLDAYLIKKIIDFLSTSQEFNLILKYILFIFLATLFGRFIENSRIATQVILGNLFSKKIHHKIVEKTSNLQFWFFEDSKFYDKLDRIRDEAMWRPLNTFYHLFDSIQALFTMLSVFAVLYFLNPVFMFLMIIFAIPSLLVQIRYGDVWWNLIFKETPEARFLQYAQELMINNKEMKDIKILGLRDFLLSKYRRLYEKLFNEQKILIEKRYFYEFITFILSDFVFIFFYVYLAYRAFIKNITIGDFTFYGTIYTRGVSALHNFVNDIGGIYQNNRFINELINFLKIKEEQEDNKEKIKNIKGTLEFKDVWFKYPGTEKWILKGISFKLPLKKSVAFVGENGAGKTTIVKLITRLYEPTKGEILLDNKPIQEYNLKEYRRLFGVTFQDFAKFYFTVEENIKFGDIHREISIDEIVKVAKKTHIHEKIIGMPLKYKTILGRWFEKGQELSHGEWQKVAIARTLIREAPIYILDEPTAALDAKAEYKVFEAFQQYTKNKTAIFISHRFSNVKLANEIIVIEHGKIKEHGTHKELMKKKGIYHELYSFQAQRYQE